MAGKSTNNAWAFICTVITVFLAIIGIWAALVAISVVLGEILSSVFDVAGRWSQVLNPAAWLDWHTGWGETFDDWLGSANAEGTTSPWLVAVCAGALAFLCWLLIGALWKANGRYDNRRI